MRASPWKRTAGLSESQRRLLSAFHVFRSLPFALLKNASPRHGLVVDVWRHGPDYVKEAVTCLVLKAITKPLMASKMGHVLKIKTPLSPGAPFKAVAYFLN